LSLLKRMVYLIVSNATFQWFNHPRKTVSGYLDCLSSEGVFAFSTFGPRTFHELHTSFDWASEQLNLPSDRHGQAFLSMDYWNGIFKGKATKHELFEQEHIELFTTVRDFLHSIKKVGASNATSSAILSITKSRLLIEKMEKHYTNTYGTELGIKATYHLSGGLYKKN
jgi:malonyl-CoA O-methyltransferase